MRVVCRFGHFALYPSDKTEVQRFMRVFGLPLYPQGDYFTFNALVGLPRWSQTALVFGTLPAVTNYEGRDAAEVMRENLFVFSLAAGLLVPMASITGTAKLNQTQDCLVAPRPLYQPGAFIEPAVRLLSYWGELDLEYQRLYIYAWEAAE